MPTHSISRGEGGQAEPQKCLACSNVVQVKVDKVRMLSNQSQSQQDVSPLIQGSVEDGKAA